MQTKQKGKSGQLHDKAENTARRISVHADGIKNAVRRQYEISAMKAKVIRLEYTLKKDFEKAGRLIYAQSEEKCGDDSIYTDRILDLYAEVDAKRELIQEMRACISSMEEGTRDNLSGCAGDMAQWDEFDEDDDYISTYSTTVPADEEDME